jgi:CubicO group peptidase (beta-lactamase class C family)
MNGPNVRRFAAAAALMLAGSASPAWAHPAPLPVASTPESVGFSSERLKRLDDRLAGTVERGEVAGMAMLVARHGKVFDVRISGERAPGQPMTRDTIFRIFSMTKPVTGVAMMILFEEGKWSLDDPVTKYVPEFANLQVVTGVDADGRPQLEPMKRPPTMRELMSHTAGFTYGFNPNNPADRMMRERNIFNSAGLPAMIQKLSDVPLLFQPGERWSYSVAVDIQGYIVEKLSGMPFGQFLQQRIFGPLKMVDTGFSIPASKLDRFAAAYASATPTGKAVPATSFQGNQPQDYSKPPSVESGGGGLVSTLDDYARFAQMLANKGELDGVRLLAPATIELMQTNVISEEALKRPTPIGIFNENIGFGLDVMTITRPREAGRLEGKGTMSWEGAAGTWFWADPANEVICVGMIQNYTRVGPNGFDPISRPLVYQALVDAAR